MLDKSLSVPQSSCSDDHECKNQQGECDDDDSVIEDEEDDDDALN